MKHLLKDYKRRLATLDEELRITINEASDITKTSILIIKRGCYRTFIAELEQITPPEKPIDPKEIEKERLAKEEEEKKYLEDRNAFNQRLLDGEFEPKEEKQPKEF